MTDETPGERGLSLNPHEAKAILTFGLRMARQRGDARLRVVLELDQSARLTVVGLIGLLPLLGALAKDTGREIIYGTMDSMSEARAKVALSRYMIFDTPVNVATWSDINKVSDRYNVATKAVVLGELDHHPEWQTNDYTKREYDEPALSVVKNLLSTGWFAPKSQQVVLLHNEGAATPFDVRSLAAKLQ